MYLLVRTSFISTSLAQEAVGIYFILKLFQGWRIHDPLVFQHSRQEQQFSSLSPFQCTFLAAVSTAYNLILHFVYCYYSLKMKLRAKRTFDHRLHRNLYFATNCLFLSSTVSCVVCWTGSMRWRKAFEQTVSRVIPCTASGSCSDREDIETPWGGIVRLYEVWRPCLRNLSVQANFTTTTTDRINSLVLAFNTLRKDGLLTCMAEAYQLQFVSWMGNYALNSLVCLHFHGTHLVFLGLWHAAALNAQQKKRYSVRIGDTYLNLPSQRSSQWVRHGSLIEDYVWDLLNRLNLQQRLNGISRTSGALNGLRTVLARGMANWTDSSDEEYLPRPASTSLLSRSSTDSEFFHALHRKRSSSATGRL